MRFVCDQGCVVEGTRKNPPPRTCPEHGSPFVYEKALGRSSSTAPSSRRRRAPMKRSEPKRDWSDARAKVEEEGCCRICKRTDRPLEAAHVLGREHDEPKVSKTTGEILKELYVHPDRVIPACGPFPEGCHGAQHNREINTQAHLTLEEQLQAVRDAGSIEAARIRLEPVNYNAEVARSAA